MDRCPKCTSLRIAGPTFRRGQGCRCHPDRLVYRCLACGYQEGRPTADQCVRKDDAAPRGAPGRRHVRPWPRSASSRRGGGAWTS